MPALALGVVLTSGLANYTGGRQRELSLLFGLSNAAEAVVVGTCCAGGGTSRFGWGPLTTSSGWWRRVAPAP